MRKLALRDEILLQIDKAARYIGGEVNAVMKNKEDVDIRFAMAFPDVYEIGMSNLGMMILYDMFNKRDDVWCERLFSPWTDLDKIMREEHIPLFTLESQDPVKEFDFLGIRAHPPENCPVFHSRTFHQILMFKSCLHILCRFKYQTVFSHLL